MYTPFWFQKPLIVMKVDFVVGRGGGYSLFASIVVNYIHVSIIIAIIIFSIAVGASSQCSVALHIHEYRLLLKTK